MFELNLKRTVFSSKRLVAAPVSDDVGHLLHHDLQP